MVAKKRKNQKRESCNNDDGQQQEPGAVLCATRTCAAFKQEKVGRCLFFLFLFLDWLLAHIFSSSWKTKMKSKLKLFFFFFFSGSLRRRWRAVGVRKRGGEWWCGRRVAQRWWKSSPTKMLGERWREKKYFLVQKFMRESCRAVLARLLALFFVILFSKI